MAISMFSLIFQGQLTPNVLICSGLTSRVVTKDSEKAAVYYRRVNVMRIHQRKFGVLLQLNCVWLGYALSQLKS